MDQWEELMRFATNHTGMVLGIAAILLAIGCFMVGQSHDQKSRSAECRKVIESERKNAMDAGVGRFAVDAKSGEVTFVYGVVGPVLSDTASNAAPQ